MTGKITVNLAHTKLDGDGESLGELLAAAVNITSGSEENSDRDKKREALWICRSAVRAACELIIREGKIKLPLQVQFADTPAILNSRLEYDGDYGLN